MYMNHLEVCVLVAQLCPALYDPMDCGLLCTWDSPGKNTGVGCHSLLQGIFPSQGSNPGLLHCRQILCHLSHQGKWLNHLGILLNAESESVGLEWGPRVCISSMFPGSAIAAGLQTTLYSNRNCPLRGEGDQTAPGPDSLGPGQ